MSDSGTMFPMNATTPWFSTMSRVRLRFRDGSPPSSAVTICTGWPLSPPREFTEAAQTWAISRPPAKMAPSNPL